MGREYTRADELSFLEQGLRSPFWGILSKRAEELRKIAENAVREPSSENRDFAAGKLVGLEMILRYPKERIESLQKLEEQK